MPPRVHHPPSAAESMQEEADGPELDSPDELVELARDFPKEVGLFVRATVWLGIFFSCIPVICALAVASSWPSCGCCKRPLQEWMFIYAALHVLQFPLKVSFLQELREASQEEIDMPQCVSRLTTSSVWKMNKVVAVLIYGWLVLGVVWSVHAGSCDLTWLCGLLIFAAGMKFVLTQILFQQLVPAQAEILQEFDDIIEQKGASWELIDSMPVIEHPSLEGDAQQDTCVVCLSDFETGECLRQLPCRHKFHRGCIDDWLSRRKVCPLCLQDVEATPPCGKMLLSEKKVA